MIELLSIHIPKTGGTSFYHLLQQAYGQALSSSLKRRDYEALIAQHGSLQKAFGPEIRAVHGHLYYRELKALHLASGAKVICWLRHPVERLLSNYRFFIHRLQHPELNPQVFEQNQHRREESLLEYARLEENRNRMSKFLEGITLEELFFIGFLEGFDTDLQQLAGLMGWPSPPTPTLPHFNQGKLEKQMVVDAAIFEELAGLNHFDLELYERARAIRRGHGK
jgi:hypothetical protein